MSKRRFISPVLLTGGLIPDDESDIIGGGSSQTGQEPFACSYDDWLMMFADDFDDNDNGEPDDIEEWKDWMEKHGFDWQEYV